MGIIKKNCPNCGEKGNIGRVYRDKEDKAMVALETALTAGVGFMLGGPVGAVAGGAAGYKGAGFLTKNRDNGKVKYLFTCQECGYEWTEWITE